MSSLENGKHFITSMIWRVIKISLLFGCFEDSNTLLRDQVENIAVFEPIDWKRPRNN